MNIKDFFGLKDIKSKIFLFATLIVLIVFIVDKKGDWYSFFLSKIGNRLMYKN